MYLCTPIRVRRGRMKCVRTYAASRKNPFKYNKINNVRNCRNSGSAVQGLVDADGAVKVGAPTVEGAKVVCEVVNPLVKGDKVIVFKMKRRKDSRSRNGHREQFTEVEIKSVIA